MDLEYFFEIQNPSKKEISEIIERETFFFVKELVPYNQDFIDTVPLNYSLNESNFIQNTSFSRIFYNIKTIKFHILNFFLMN